MITEAVVWRCSTEKEFLKISQNSRENMYRSPFFNEVADQAFNFIKKDSVAQMFPVNFAKFLRAYFFYKTPLVAASVITLVIKALAHEYSQTSPNI